MPHKITWPVTPPVFRKDAAPRHPNPIRRFREELRLNREDFAALCGVGVPTLRGWERTTPDVAMPRSKVGMRLIELAKRNKYPLTFNDMRKFVDERHIYAVSEWESDDEERAESAASG